MLLFRETHTRNATPASVGSKFESVFLQGVSQVRTLVGDQAGVVPSNTRHTGQQNQVDRARVREVRIQSPPAESRANFRFLSGGVGRGAGNAARFTAPAYWKFESIPLQQRNRLPPATTFEPNTRPEEAASADAKAGERLAAYAEGLSRDATPGRRCG